MKQKILFPVLVFMLLSGYKLSAQDTTGLAIDQHRFEQLMKKKKNVLLDVRTPEEYQSGYIGDAVNNNVMDSLGFVNSVNTLSKKKNYLLYCKSGRRSGMALVMMKNMGFKKVHHLKGGITDC